VVLSTRLTTGRKAAMRTDKIVLAILFLLLAIPFFHGNAFAAFCLVFSGSMAGSAFEKEHE